MSLYYDELVAGNSFGQINILPSSKMDPSTTNNHTEPNSMLTSNEASSASSIVQQLGFPLDNLFQMARQFLKEKQGSRAIQLKYADTIRFAALSKQATIGKWDAAHTQNVGLLDVLGNDRKQAWMSLGEMSKEQAREEFIKLLVNRCPMFEHYVEAHHVENEEKDRLRKEDENRRTLEQEAERIRQQEIEQVSRLEEQRKKREEFQRKQIQDALNQQTYPQFKAYAEQQYRDNRAAQDELIRQLQEQHFQQYMQQVYQQQLLRNKTNTDSSTLNTSSSSSSSATVPTSSTSSSINQLPPMASVSQSQPVSNGSSSLNESAASLQTSFESLSIQTPLQPPPSSSAVTGATSSANEQNQSTPTAAVGATGLPVPSIQANFDYKGQDESLDVHGIDPSLNDADGNDESSEGAREYPPIAVANMWTRKDIKEFKDALRKEKDTVIKIGSGETISIRVPTHENGRCIFWEFATDYYDIGFGLYFEWTKSQSNTVTVHVSDSSEDDEEGEDGGNPEKQDIEKGSRNSNKPPKPYQDEIIPIFRRDSHEEIYAGSHTYPGHGVYLLKFDNTYSLWRSKTLYYRVYYSR